MMLSQYEYTIQFIIACITFCFLIVSYFRLKFHLLRLQSNVSSQRLLSNAKQAQAVSIAFFHPHCTGGGGGERVLWKAVESISQLNQNNYERKEKMNDKLLNRQLHVVIYTSDEKKDNYYQGKFSE